MSLISKTISISCWNCLADCYTYNMGVKSINQHWDHRKPIISKIITETNTDLICLQEVDHYCDFYKPLLESLEKKIIYCQRNHKDDGSCIAYNNDRFVLIDTQSVYFDDLANIIPSQKKDYLKHNVALMAKFKDTYNNDKEFVASTAHLYWNPAKPEVKHKQAYYLKKKVLEFADSLPMIVCGDFNSFPDSSTINIVSGGKQKMEKGNVYSFSEDKNVEAKQQIIYKGNDTKFICDDSLNKLCRRMRLLGIDCALETEESKILRTSSKRGCKQNYQLLFNQALEERRVILTTSRIMREISSCPQSMMINTRNLDQALLEICEEYEIELKPDRFLTVCGKCGGSIDFLNKDDHKNTKITLPDDDRPIYACNICKQPYWWSESKNSSPVRAMAKATEIYDTFSKARNTLLNLQNISKIESNVDLESLDAKFKRRDDTMKDMLTIKTKENIENSIDEIDNELKSLIITDNYVADSANKIDDKELLSTFYVYNGKHPEFTNWLNDFKGVLDYIYVSKEWKINHATILPNAVSSSLPSDKWPSDHLMLKSLITLD